MFTTALSDGKCILVQVSERIENSIAAVSLLLEDQEVLRNDAIILLQFLVYRSRVAQDRAIREKCIDKTFSIYRYVLLLSPV